MEKIYRVTLIFLFIILILANVAFFAIGDEFLTYLRVNTELETPYEIINQSKSTRVGVPSVNLFDISIAETEKFNRLKDFRINLDDIILPGDLSPGEQIEIGEDGEVIIRDKEPEFEVGNPNPFSPVF